MLSFDMGAYFSLYDPCPTFETFNHALVVRLLKMLFQSSGFTELFATFWTALIHLILHITPLVRGASEAGVPRRPEGPE